MRYTVEVLTAQGAYVVSGSYPDEGAAAAEVSRLQALAGRDVARLGPVYTCTPPPDPAKPYAWLDGRWLLVATDRADE